MKYIKKYEERQYKYQKGDYVIPIGDNPKDSYTIIASVYNSSMPYMLHTFRIYDGKQIEQFPVTEDEIVRKMTKDEINMIKIKIDSKKYNI